MKSSIIGIILFSTFFQVNLLGQNDSTLALQSLLFFNKQFVLHLEKMNEPILININDNNYICLEFINKERLQPIAELRFNHKLNKIGETQYEFNLKVVSEFKGSFEVIEENGRYYFTNLKYVKKTY